MISKACVVGAYHGKLRELSRMGVELTVVVPHHWGKQELEAVPADSYNLRVMDCVFSGAHHLHFYPSLSKIIGSKSWDLIHIDEEPFNLVTYHALRACARSGTRTIFFTWQNIHKHYPPPFNLFQRFVFRRVCGAIAGNEEAREVLLARDFARPIAVIPQFGVDLGVFRKRQVPELRAKLGLTQKFVIGYVGRIIEAKGIGDLVQALALLPAECVLALVGSGEFEFRAKQLAKALGIAGRIRWIPHVSSPDIPDYVNTFDALVLPSRTTPSWKEQFGRVLVEAMACEIPVIGSDSGEIPRVVGESGLMFPEGNVAALVHHLCSLHGHLNLRLELGAKGRARVSEKFTHQRIAQETVSFYEQMLSRSGADDNVRTAA